MASSVKKSKPAEASAKRQPRKPRIFYWEVGVFLFIVLIFVLKSTNYMHNESLRPSHIFHGITHSVSARYTSIRKQAIFNSCPKDKVKVSVSGGFLCRDKVADSVWQNIYDSYPLNGNGRENIYPSLDNGSIQRANDLLNNKVDIERYAPYAIGHAPNWTEDPYNDRYWRFNYYGLRPLTDLLYASRTTNNPVYQKKLLALTDSFIDTGMNKPHAWDDYHAVAFRAMILNNIWWKLRAENALPVADSTKILKALEVHGDFLEDRNHYEPEHNHGTNEAAALNLLAVSMPDLPHAKNWRPVAIERINSSLDSLIDSDGVLIENSPYYHFYTLQKYWDLYHYSQQQHEKLGSDFEAKLNKMIDYATYILEPNSHIPLLGASLDSTINAHAEYAQMARSDPAFAYVLSHGKRGKEPTSLNKFYATTGQTIMRSGWGEGNNYTNQTQLTFDVGPYRTSHSDLDALSLTLYGAGKELLPDAGLYTYSPGVMRDYFHGTSSHNTVVVDGKDQFQGTAKATKLVQKDGYTYQSAQHQLYDGVTHERNVTMLDKNHVLVVDKMLSDQQHTYQQLFHLFPGAKLTKNGLTVTAMGTNHSQSLTITQLNPSGISESEVINQTTPKPDGLCSEQYGKTLPCYAISYNQKTTNATYATLLTIGPADPNFSVKYDAKTSHVYVSEKHKKLDFTLTQQQAKPSSAKASDPKAPTPQTSAVPAFDQPGNWSADTAGSLDSGSEEKDAFLKATTDSGQTEFQLTNNAVRLDLSQQNITLKIKVKNRPNLNRLTMSFSNNNWQSSVSDDLLTDCRTEYDGEWLNISLGKSMLRNRNGHWQLKGAAFDWSRIDGARFSIKSDGQQTSDVYLGELSTLAEQRQGKVVIIFDDGYDSILPAADYLHEKGLKANVAVISKYVATPSFGHLNTNDLKMLQNKYGWNMVNHTSQHQDALQTYYAKNNMEGYESDVLAGAKFLKDNGLNSASNWFVYPHGAANYSIKKVISKYYKFARVTVNDTEVYPFTDPYGVKTMSIQNSGDGEDASPVATTVDQVARSVADAKTYKTTLFLTFHRIHSRASDKPGYELSDFKKIVDNLKQQGIDVDTLSELDASNHVGSNDITFYTGVPQQIDVNLAIHRSFLGKIQYINHGISNKINWVWKRI